MALRGRNLYDGPPRPELVRWPSEAVGTGWQSTASEGHRTKPQIVTGCGKYGQAGHFGFGGDSLIAV